MHAQWWKQILHGRPRKDSNIFKSILLLHSHNQLYVYIYVRKHSQLNNNERTQFLRKIYFSHFIRNGWKGLCVRGELETEQTATYWPQIPLSLAALLSRSAGLLNRGSWGPSPLWELVLTTVSYFQLDWLQLTEHICGPGLYNCWTSTCFLWVSHLHPIQPVHSQGYTLISSTGYTCSLIDGWVGGQYVTLYLNNITLTNTDENWSEVITPNVGYSCNKKTLNYSMRKIYA